MNKNACYHIRVNGRLEESWLRWFEEQAIHYLDNGETLIALTAVDQPALFGVINRIRDLGLELISRESRLDGSNAYYGRYRYCLIPAAWLLTNTRASVA